jgi:DNA/RNA-binding domain of Phe-tRNA-synthetase-like protein
MKLTFNIDPRLAEVFPHARIGILTGVIDDLGAIHELDELVAQIEDEVRLRAPTSDAVAAHPHIQSWREAYRKMGVNPKRHKPTMEALLMKVLKTGRMPRICTVVDCYLLAELKYFVPYGGYDMDRLGDNLHLALSPGDEPFTPIGGLGGTPERTGLGEIVYRNAHQVLTRRWNQRDADATKIDPNTRRFVLMCEAADARVSVDALVESLHFLRHLLFLCARNRDSAWTEIHFLDMQRLSYTWECPQ